MNLHLQYTLVYGNVVYFCRILVGIKHFSFAILSTRGQFLEQS